MLQNYACVAGMPGTLAGLECGKPSVRQLRQITVTTMPFLRLTFLRHDAKHATSILVVDILPANVSVMPVQHVHPAVGTDLHAKSDPLCIVGQQEVISVTSHEPGTLRLQNIRKHCVLVNVRHKDTSLVLLRERIGQIDTSSTVR